VRRASTSRTPDAPKPRGSGIGLSGHFEVAILPNLFLELEVGAEAPIVRPRFYYSSGVTAFRPAEVGGRMSLTFAVRL
jgi:hypothetical protein